MCAVGNATDGVNGFKKLSGALNVATFTIGASSFAIVASPGDDSVQLIDASDPSSLIAVSSATDGHRGFTMLKRASFVDTFTIGDGTFAIAVSGAANGVQLIDVSNPRNPMAASNAEDGRNGFDTLSGASGVGTFTVDGKTFAIVTSFYDDGVQLIDVSDPHHLVPAGSAKDGREGFDILNRATEVATWVDGDSTFAIVTSAGDDGVQIIDVSDPGNPLPVSSAIDGENGFDMLDRASGVAMFLIGDSTFAIVASVADDGVQLIDVSNPRRPIAVGSATDGEKGFTKLAMARSVTTMVIGVTTYALVTGFNDNGVQLIDVTNPSRPVAVGSATDGARDFNTLRGAFGVAAFEIDTTMYAIVASRDDDGVQLIHVRGGEGEGEGVDEPPPPDY